MTQSSSWRMRAEDMVIADGWSRTGGPGKAIARLFLFRVSGWEEGGKGGGEMSGEGWVLLMKIGRTGATKES